MFVTRFKSHLAILLTIFAIPVISFRGKIWTMPRPQPVFWDSTGPEKEVFLVARDFYLAKNHPVPDQADPAGNEENLQKLELIEGDIEGFTKQSFKEFIENNYELVRTIKDRTLGQSAIRDLLRRWPDKMIPYRLSSHFTQPARTKIAQAVSTFHEKTCVRFVPRTVQRDYIFITSRGPGICSSLIGRAGGQQTINLGEGCLIQGIIEHELMHSLGFFHEQSRTDRDNFVRILWQNIKPATVHNFEKYPHNVIDPLNTPYDYFSIMHYPRKAFSHNGKDTIIPLHPGVEIGQKIGMSMLDIHRINKLYHSSSPPLPGTTPPPVNPPTLHTCPPVTLPTVKPITFPGRTLSTSSPVTSPRVSSTPTSVTTSPSKTLPIVKPITFTPPLCPPCPRCPGCRGCPGCFDCPSCPQCPRCFAINGYCPQCPVCPSCNFSCPVWACQICPPCPLCPCIAIPV